MRSLPLLLIIAFACAEEFKDLSNGFGTDVEWIDWAKASNLSDELKKPVFLLIHKTWCGACKQLKKSFETNAKRDEFIKLSRKFVMVNLEDDDEPEDDKFAPDGRYIPRLYFLKGGELLDVTNKAYPKNLYYFPQLNNILEAMKRALKAYDAEEAPAKEEAKVEEEEKPKKEEEKPKKAEKKEEKEEKKAEKKEEKPKKKVDKKDTKKEAKKDEKKDEKKSEKPKKDEKKADKDKKSKDKKEKPKKEEKKSEGEECPHAKKAREEKKAKSKTQTEDKSGKDTKEETKSKAKQQKKSEL